MTSERPNVVLVDDDIDFIEINRRVLEAKGYRALCYSNAKEALEGMESEQPDLVITDLMMRALDSGFSFSQKIKERFRSVPVIIVTAVGSRLGYDFHPQTSAELRAMHVDAYFDKPISPELLTAKVEELLKSSIGEHRNE